nr:MAG TPA: hypothetical protein [Caudoviricetes sp.]
MYSIRSPPYMPKSQSLIFDWGRWLYGHGYKTRSFDEQ